MQPGQELKCLEKLIAGLGGAVTGGHSTGPCALLLEHLDAARRDLLGAMPGEYRSSLRDAKRSTDCIADGAARDSTRKTLQDLLDSDANTRPYLVK